MKIKSALLILMILLISANGCYTKNNTIQSQSSSDLTIPAVPSNIVVTAGDGQITLSWSAVEDALIYNIYWSTSSDISITNGSKIYCASNPFTHINLNNGITYYFIITAANSAGESSASAPVNATPALNPPPAAPTGVDLTPGN
jgi:fibronectin type 3 domain-containing protein